VLRPSRRHRLRTGRWNTHPFGLGSVSDANLTPPIAFLRPVPHHLAAIQRAVEHLIDRGMHPSRRPSLLGPRSRNALSGSASSQSWCSRWRPADSSKIRRTTAASASLMRCSTYERAPLTSSTSTSTSTLSYPKHRPPATWPARAWRTIESVTRCRAHWIPDPNFSHDALSAMRPSLVGNSAGNKASLNTYPSLFARAALSFVAEVLTLVRVLNLHVCRYAHQRANM
jgi:hypothetical protein